jgi:hypothetical protein
MEEAIYFRIIVWRKKNQFRAVCLETNLAFQAKTKAELHKKIKDGLLSYIECFSKQEIISKAYLRPAPIKYHCLWLLKPIMVWINSSKPTKANYNLQSGKLRFA